MEAIKAYRQKLASLERHRQAWGDVERLAKERGYAITCEIADTKDAIQRLEKQAEKLAASKALAAEIAADTAAGKAALASEEADTHEIETRYQALASAYD